MTFLEPSFLYALPALTIPVVVHFFSFKKKKRIYFSNTLFLQNINQKTASRRNLRHLLILLARLLFISSLVLAFAQPVGEHSSQQAITQTTVLVYLDNSMSMGGIVDNNTSSFNQSLSDVMRLMLQYPKGTIYYLITNDFSSIDFVKYDEETLKDRLAELKHSARQKTFGEVNDRIGIIKQQQKLTDVDVFWFSDFQKSTFGTDESIFKSLKDSTINIALLPMSFEKKNNLFVDSVYLEEPYITDYESLVVYAKIKNSGDISIQNVNIKLTINNIQIATLTENFGAEEIKTISFQVQHLERKDNLAKITIDDVAVHFDDDFYFTLKMGRVSKVCTIYGEKSSPRIFESVYAEKNRFMHKTFSEKNIDFGYMQEANLIILYQIEKYTSNLIDQINSSVHFKHANVIFVPSTNAPIPKGLFHTKSLFTKNYQALNQNILITDIKDPLFKNVFEDDKKKFNLPKATRSINLIGYHRAILSFEDQTAFLAVYGYKQSIFAFSSPLESQYTEFHKHALFVPVMYKIATYRLENHHQLYHRISQQQITVRLDSTNASTLYKLKKNNQEYVPSQHLSDNLLTMRLPAANIQSGFYQLINSQQMLAFDAPNSESQMNFYSTDELINKFKAYKQVSIRITDTNEKAINKIKERFHGVSCWKYFIFFALLSLFSEIALIRVWKN